jgi:hypothetical protein
VARATPPADTSQGPEAVTALALAKSVRSTQIGLQVDLLRKVTEGWPSLNFSQLDRTWPGWLAMMQALVAEYHQELAAQSSLLYRGTRQLEIGEPGPQVLAAPPAEEWTKKALGYAAPGVYEKALRQQVERQAAEHKALVTTLGTTTRIALDGARQTMVDAGSKDHSRVRYFRVTDGDPCYFCALAASRGAVYRSAFTAGDGNAYHDHDSCTVGVTFVGGHQLDGPAAEAARIYDSVAHLTGKERLNAFRRLWESRERPAAIPAQAA